MAIYTPIHGDEIRLLDIDANLNGTLRRATVASEYTALSYVWGTNLDCKITIDGHPFPVTRNLFNALQELAPRTLWVDQICINQEDSNEKLYQIQLMPKIFRENVIGWLDIEQSYSGLVIQFLKELEHTALEYAPGFVEWAWPGYTKRHTVTPCTRLLVFCKILLGRPWFKRRWIIQEAAASNLILHCGGESIGADQFFNAIEKLSSAEISQEVLSLRRRPREILLLLDGFSAWDCTIKEDRLVALVGISNTRWTPTYKETFLDFATWHIENTHSLEILHYANDYDTTPSWVPDWRQTNLVPLRGGSFTALEAQFRVQGRSLHVKGCILGTLLTHVPFQQSSDHLIKPGELSKPEKDEIGLWKPEDAAAQLRGLADLLPGRQIFVTKVHGATTYGIGPISAKIGSTLWSIPGLSLPIIVFDQRLVGTCRLPGHFAESPDSQWLELI